MSHYWFNRENFKHGNENKFNLVWLLIFAVSLIFFGIGLRDPWPADEPRFALIAKEMVESGNWFFPMRGGELYPDKPPLFMWFIAFFYSITGSIKISFLLPSAISSVISVVAVYDLARRFWNSQTAWYASLLLLLTLQFTLQSKMAQIDATVTCFITLGCYGMLRHLVEQENWPWYFLACFFMGLGVITKGVGFLPILMLGPYVIARYYWPLEHEIRSRWLWFVGIASMLLAVMLWFVPMLMQVAQHSDPLFAQYRDNILFRQTAVRYAKSLGHVKPFWYYIVAVIPVFWLPISLMLPWLAKHWKQAVKAGDRRIIIPLVWIALVIIFFSISPGKRGVYLLPAVPMLSLITAPYLRDILTKKIVNNLVWYLIAFLAVCLIVFSGLGMLGIEKAQAMSAKFGIEPWFMTLTIGVFGVLAIVASRKQKWKSWLYFMPIFWVIYSSWGYQLFSIFKTPKAIFQAISEHVSPDAELGLVKFSEQFIYFSPYQTTHFGYHTEVQDQQRAAWLWIGKRVLSGDKPRYILTKDSIKMSCFDSNKAIKLGFAHRRHWQLYGPDSRLATCPEPGASVREFVYTPK